MSRIAKLGAFGKPGEYVLSIILRSLQILFAGALLGLSIAKIDLVGIIVGGLIIIYDFPMFFIYPYVNTVVVTIFEGIMLVISLADAVFWGFEFGLQNCETDFITQEELEHGFPAWCPAREEKVATFAVAAVCFLLFLATFALHVEYTLAPYSKIKGAAIRRRALTIGGIFPLNGGEQFQTDATDPTELAAGTDLEANIQTEAEAEAANKAVSASPAPTNQYEIIDDEGQVSEREEAIANVSDPHESTSHAANVGHITAPEHHDREAEIEV